MGEWGVEWGCACGIGRLTLREAQHNSMRHQPSGAPDSALRPCREPGGITPIPIMS